MTDFKPSMSWKEFFDGLLAQGISAGDDAIEQHKDQILKAASDAGISLTTHSTALIDDAIDHADFGFFGNQFKGSIIRGINQALINVAQESDSQEAALFALLVTALRNYAKQIETAK